MAKVKLRRNQYYRRVTQTWPEPDIVPLLLRWVMNRTLITLQAVPQRPRIPPVAVISFSAHPKSSCACALAGSA
jgi:hypothetical protein